MIDLHYVIYNVVIVVYGIPTRQYVLCHLLLTLEGSRLSTSGRNGCS